MKKEEIIQLIEERKKDSKKWKPNLLLPDYYEYLTTSNFRLDSVEYIDETIIKADNKSKYFILIIPVIVLLFFFFADRSDVEDIAKKFINGEVNALVFVLVISSIFFFIPIYFSFKNYKAWILTKHGFKYGDKEIFFSDVQYICYRVIQSQGCIKELNILLKNGTEIKFEIIQIECSIGRFGEIFYVYFKKYKETNKETNKET